MAKLRVPVERAAKMLADLIQSGEEVAAKIELADKKGAYRDWLDLFAAWRKHSIDVLKTIYEGSETATEFQNATDRTERPSPSSTFEYRKGAIHDGIQKLGNLIDRLPLALAQSEDAAGIRSLHPEIYSRCHTLYASGDYAEAVEKSFKVVRDRLRSLTTFEKGAEAFGKGNLYIDGAAAPHVDGDFQEGVKFLTMAIDRFRNEKAHTADGNITDPIRAYEYLRLSSLAMHLLDRAHT